MTGSTVSGWGELVATALLGTERRPVPQDSLDALQWPTTDHEAASLLLDLASAYTPYRRAGALPDTHEAVATAPAQELQLAPAAAQDLLGQLIDTRAVATIDEWLAVCVRQGLGIAPQLWPTLADLCLNRRDVDLGALQRAYGRRGRAFLTLREEWSPLLAAQSTTDDEATTSVGRAQIAEEWESASAAEKVALLGALARSLSPEDEPFLAQALTDRRMSVGSKAAELLSAMPTSTYSRRMTERAHAAIVLERHRIGKDRLVINVPDDEIEGVPAKPPASFPLGPRSWVLYNLVATADIARWREHTGLSPGELLSLAADTDWADALRGGWHEAAVRQRDIAWAAALVGTGDLDEALVAVVPPPGRVDLARALFQGGAGLSQLVALVQHCPTPLPGDLVAAVVALIRAGKASGPWAAEAFGRVIGINDLPQLTDAVRRGPDAQATHPAAVERALAALHDAVAAKAAVHLAFSPPASTGEQP
jgi:hypothetical protein